MKVPREGGDSLKKNFFLLADIVFYQSLLIALAVTQIKRIYGLVFFVSLDFLARLLQE